MKHQQRAPIAARSVPANSDLLSQREYVRQMANDRFAFDLMVAGAFVRGIRDIGYRSTATALDELIDNAIQAGAENIAVAFRYAHSDEKPSQIAVLDDGHGMDPEMLRLSIIWGGTHREGDRSGFGRYGYGLPSASVSQGRRFCVQSRTASGAWHSVALDLDELGKGAYNREGRVVAPTAEPAELAEWINSFAAKHLPNGLPQGTAVVIDKLDRLTWKTRSALQRHLLEHLGVTYRNFLREVNIWVEAQKVEPIDPLFLTPGARFYDLDEDRAEGLEPTVIDVKDGESRDPLGVIKVRFAYMPPTFQIEKEAKKLAAKGRRGRQTNARLPIMKEHNGIIVLRQGRQIDVVRSCPWTAFQTNDYNWAVEVDFPATVDEEFSITTSKQQVTLSDRIWDILEQHGVRRAIDDLRKRAKRDTAQLKAGEEMDPSRKRASEQALEQASMFKTRKPAPEQPAQAQKASQALQREVDRRSSTAGIPRPEVERQLLAEIQGNPYKVEFASLTSSGPVYDAEMRGGQHVLRLNRDHRFYTDVYAGPESSPRLRAAVEVVLWVLAECEMDATEERRQFYEAERGEWSSRLHTTLGRLELIHPFEPAPQEAEDVARPAGN